MGLLGKLVNAVGLKDTRVGNTIKDAEKLTSTNAFKVASSIPLTPVGGSLAALKLAKKAMSTVVVRGERQDELLKKVGIKNNPISQVKNKIELKKQDLIKRTLPNTTATKIITGQPIINIKEKFGPLPVLTPDLIQSVSPTAETVPQTITMPEDLVPATLPIPDLPATGYPSVLVPEKEDNTNLYLISAAIALGVGALIYNNRND